MTKNKTSIKDIINPQVKNILLKMSRLHIVLKDMSGDTKIELEEMTLEKVRVIVEKNFKSHKSYKESIALIDKLTKLKLK